MMRSTDFLTFGIGVAAVLCTFSCAKENIIADQVPGETGGMIKISLTADIRQTKTTLDRSEVRLAWSDGDSFDLFSDGGDGKSTPVYNSGDAEISAEVNEGATEIYAVYPANPASTAANVVVTVPEAQTQTAGGVMNGANVPMYAKGSIDAEGKAALSFSPVAGIIALNVYSTETTSAKVTKVQVNPLDSDGNLVLGGFCGKAETSAAGFDYAPEGESAGVVLTLGTPCAVASEKPADEEATKNFDGQLYISLARAEYAGIQFIVTTDDGKMYVAASSKPLDLSAGTGHDILYLNLNLAGKSEISDDFYGQYMAGLDITICGNVINRRTYPKAQVKTMAELTWAFLASPFDDEANGGILFIDNSTAASRPTAATKEIGHDRIIIGRYRNVNQPIFKMNPETVTEKKCYWVLDGKVMLRNITLSSYRTEERSLFAGKSGASHGESEFFFEDCTLTNTNTTYGIFTETSASYAVPKSMRFDNCIFRANAEFFSCSDRRTSAAAEATSAYFESMQNLKSLTFNECVFAPATLVDGSNEVFADNVKRLAKNGAIVAMFHPNYKFDDLDISFSRCSSYDLGPASSARGLVDVTTAHSVTVANCIFWHSATINNMYLTYVLQNCTGASYNVSATYSNKVGDYIMSYGPKSKFTANGGKCEAYINQQDDLFGTCEPAKHYFPKSPTFSMVAGADYGKNYWIVPSGQQQ